MEASSVNRNSGLKGLNKPWDEQLLDQTLHFLAAFFACLILSIGGWEITAGQGIVLALFLWFAREPGEGGNMFSGGSLLDTSGWVLGGAVGGAL